MSYFASSTTSTLDVKSLPGMLSFHSAYITTGSFNPGTGQCNLFLAIEPTSSQVTYKLGLKGVDGNLLKNPSFRSDDVGSVYSALETTLTVMAANNKHPQSIKTKWTKQKKLLRGAWPLKMRHNSKREFGVGLFLNAAAGQEQWGLAELAGAPRDRAKGDVLGGEQARSRSAKLAD